MLNPRGLLMKRKKLLRFEEIFDRVHQLYERNFKDHVVDLENVRVLPDGDTTRPSIFLEIPGMGRLAITEWAKRQLGAIVGVKFDKWFDPAVISAKEVQEELQRRFSRTHESRKIRARKHAPGDPGAKHSDGFVRAILSPTYAPIDDVRLFERLKRRFRRYLEETSFIQNHLGSDFFNDRASHYCAVSEPVNMGPIDRGHPDKRVRDIYTIAEKEGLLPDDDWIYQGFHFRNSEVGYTAVTIDSSIFRLVCLNGMIVASKKGRLLYRVHRSIDDKSIDSLLDGAFRKMPESWERNRKKLISMRDEEIAEPEKEIVGFLTRQKASKVFQESVLEAYAAEPLPNKYGVMQAISRAAQQEKDMDKRALLEEMAGQYMERAV